MLQETLIIKIRYLEEKFYLDELSWNLQPLKIDNLLPPDLDLTVEDEEKTIENIPIQDLQTPKSSQNTDFPLADDVSRIVQEKIDQLNIEIEKHWCYFLFP